MASIQQKNKAEGKIAGKRMCVNLLFTTYNPKTGNNELASEWIHSEEVTTLQPLSFNKNSINTARRMEDKIYHERRDKMAVLNINTISCNLAKNIESGNESINERLKLFHDSSIRIGRQIVHAGSMAEASTLHQTEGYQGYTKTLRPAATVLETGASVMATMSAVQLSRDYNRFNKEHGTEIQNYLDSLKPSEKERAIIANVDDKIKIVNQDIFTTVVSKDFNGNDYHQTELIRNKVIEVHKQRPITVGDWNKRSLFHSQIDNNIRIATTHSKTKLAKDGAIHCYRHNPTKALSQAKKLEKELNKRVDVANIKTNSVKVTTLRNDLQIKAIVRKLHLEKPVGLLKINYAHKKVKGIKLAKGVDLNNGDILLQIAGKKAMAAKGAKAIAGQKGLASLRKAQMSFMRTTGMIKNNDFGEGYQVMQKVTMVAKPLVNKMTLKAIKKMLLQSGKIATKIVKRVGVQTIATGVHAYNSYSLAKNGGVAPAKNIKTAAAMFKKNQVFAKNQTTDVINLINKKTTGAIQKKIIKPLKKVTSTISAPLRKFILNNLSKFKNTAFAKGAGALGRGIGKVFGGIGKVIGFALKPFLALFRGLAAIFSTISSFLFNVAFAYALLFAMIMASGSLLSGVFGIFDSISNGVSEAWSNTDPNVNYAVDEIQEASNELSNVTKMQEDIAVISTIIDKLPISQLWRKLTKQETETCAGYDIVLVGETEHYLLEIPSADNTINNRMIDIRKNSKGMLQENDREILSIVSNLYESYGGISNTFNIGKQIEKTQWKTLVQQLYILSHNTNMSKEEFVVNNYSVNYWTGVATVTSSSTYYKWLIEVSILRGTEFFSKCGDLALEAGKRIDPEIEIKTNEELLEWYIASMEKEELWDENSDIKYKGYEFTYFDATDGILARIANNFKSTPQSQYTYDYSDPPENVYIVNSDGDSSFEYVRVVQKEDGSYDTTGGTFKVSNGSLSVGTVFTSDKDGNPSQKEQEYIDKYLEENNIEVKENTTDGKSGTGSTSSGKPNKGSTSGSNNVKTNPNNPTNRQSAK